MTKLFLNTIKSALIIILMCCATAVLAQVKTDSLSKEVPASKINATADTLHSKKVDSVLHVHTPRKAIIRSAIIPGWGQVYNKKYWKLPLVYGALGACAAVFSYNLTNYKATRFAYRTKYDIRVNNADSSNYFKIRANLQPLSEESLRAYRDEFRRDVDYSVLVFILVWGLNVVDAAVDAHLKSFDVSPDLGLNFKIGHSEMANTNGVSLVLSFK